VDELKEAGFTVQLANTTAIKKYDGLKHSGDEADARYLANRNHTGARAPCHPRSCESACRKITLVNAIRQPATNQTNTARRVKRTA